MNVLHGTTDRPVNSSSNLLSAQGFQHHLFGAFSSSSPANMPQRSPFAIQELLGLGNHDSGPSMSSSSSAVISRSPLANQGHTAGSVAHNSQPFGGVNPAYHPRPSLVSQSQCFSDPSRMYFNTAAFMANVSVQNSVATGGPTMPVLGLDQTMAAAAAHAGAVARNDPNAGRCR